MQKALAVAVAALGLIAWVDPKTAGPQVSKDAAAAEAKRQALYAFNARWKEMRRVEDIAYRIQVANQELCADRQPRLGIAWDTLDGFETRFRAAATEALQLRNDLTVTRVVSGSPAAAAGLEVGDELVSLN